MSAHVSLNLLNKLGKREKMRGLPSILSLFRNEFNKFNNTRARMLDSIYHMTNTLKSHFWRKNVMILSLWSQHYYGRHNVSRKSINTSGLSILLHGVISLPDTTSYDKWSYFCINWPKSQGRLYIHSQYLWIQLKALPRTIKISIYWLRGSL